MDNLTVFNRNGQFVVDSREVAEMLGKRHADLLETIDGYVNFLTNGNFRSLDFFIKSTYQDAKGETRPCYEITRKGCDMVANKMTGEKGVLFTAAYVTRFEEMEKKLQGNMALFIPRDYPSALRALADQYEENQKLLPKAESYDSLINSDGFLSVEQAAKVLNFKDVGRNNLFKILESEKITFKRAEIHRVYQQYIDSGYFVEKVKPITISNRTEPYVQIFVTPRGLDWLDKYLQKKGYKKSGTLQEAK